MEDNYGHQISYLRISITDRCNERCLYCLPAEDQEWLDRSNVLDYEEILRVIRVAVGLGVRKVRVTGGEPLTRRNVLWFLEELSKIPQLEQIGLSTNGTLLANSASTSGYEDLTIAQALRQIGLHSINVSLDTLDPEAYQQTTGRHFLDKAISGIDAACDAGFERIKINTVLMRGKNEHELADMIRFAGERNLLLRFIELMPVSSRQVLTEENFLSISAARRQIEYYFGALHPRPDFVTNGPSSYFELAETGQLIGFIGAMTNLQFCESCNKLRLTCDGKLRPCLGSHLEFDMREVLRDPAQSDEDIARFFLSVVDRKPEQHDFRDNYQPGRKMIAIGG